LILILLRVGVFLVDAQDLARGVRTEGAELLRGLLRFLVAVASLDDEALLDHFDDEVELLDVEVDQDLLDGPLAQVYEALELVGLVVLLRNDRVEEVEVAVLQDHLLDLVDERVQDRLALGHRLADHVLAVLDLDQRLLHRI